MNTKLNYINPGRVVLFQDDCDLYPSVEVAPFSATGLSDLKNSFSGNFYYNSLSDREDTEVLADISGIVSSSTPGREHGVFEAQFGEVFTWENVTYKSTVCSYVSVFVCVCDWVFLLCVCVHVCACVNVHVLVCIRTFIFMYICAYIRAHSFLDALISACLYICISMFPCVHSTNLKVYTCT